MTLVRDIYQRVSSYPAIQPYCLGVKSGRDITRAELEKALRKNPDVLIEAIKANRMAIFEIINEATLEQQARAQNEAEEAEKAAYEESFKHLPLPFHPHAMPAAQWLEAVAIQSPEKAWKFHDILFKNQDRLGADFFRTTAGDLGVDVVKCEKDAQSQAVKDRIAADMDEARNFGFEGTPGFLLNGVPVIGAKPPAHFEDVITRLNSTKAK